MIGAVAGPVAASSGIHRSGQGYAPRRRTIPRTRPRQRPGSRHPAKARRRIYGLSRRRGRADTRRGDAALDPRSLAIPPAWTEVWICADPAGHIQAVGRDARRPQAVIAITRFGGPCATRRSSIACWPSARRCRRLRARIGTPTWRPRDRSGRRSWQRHGAIARDSRWCASATGNTERANKKLRSQ